MSAPGLRAMPTLAELLDAPERAMELSPAHAAVVLAKAEGLAAVAWARLTNARGGDGRGWEPAPRHEEPAAIPEGERLLTPKQVATSFGRSVEWVYRQAKRNPDWEPFTRRDGRTLRFYPGLLAPRAPAARAGARTRTRLTPLASTH